MQLPIVGCKRGKGNIVFTIVCPEFSVESVEEFLLEPALLGEGLEAVLVGLDKAEWSHLVVGGWIQVIVLGHSD